MFEWIYTKSRTKIYDTKHEYHVLTLPENLCDIFCMNPQIYRRKNTIPNQNMPHNDHFYAASPLTFDQLQHHNFHTSTELTFFTYNVPVAN